MIDCPSAYVVDGDTLRCGPDRIRLLGIDAPEIEHCPRWRTCAPGDGQASKRSLIGAMRLGPVRYEPVTIDRYGRTVAVVWAGQANLSCWQLQHSQAIYKPTWDNGGVIARACRVAATSPSEAGNRGGKIGAVPAATITRTRISPQQGRTRSGSAQLQHVPASTVDSKTAGWEGRPAQILQFKHGTDQAGLAPGVPHLA